MRKRTRAQILKASGLISWQEYNETLTPTDQAKRDIIARLETRFQETARRFHHPTAAERRQSERSTAALRAWEPSEAFLRAHCQFDGLPLLDGKKTK